MCILAPYPDGRRLEMRHLKRRSWGVEIWDMSPYRGTKAGKILQVGACVGDGYADLFGLTPNQRRELENTGKCEIASQQR
jgi:hypothetical protein